MSYAETNALTTIVPYPWPAELEPSEDFELRINGQRHFVHPSGFGSFASVDLTERAEVEIDAGFDFERVKVRPLRRGVEPTVEGRTVRFTLEEAGPLSIEFDDQLRRPLWLFANPPEESGERPDPADPAVHYFAGGQVHEVGLLELGAGESVYLEAGAVVRARIFGEGLTGVKIGGRGMLDLSRFERRSHRGLVLSGCRDVEIAGITIFDSGSWTVVPIGCEDVDIRGIRIVNGSACDDGIDLVACRRVRVADVFIRTKDDCVAIKAKQMSESEHWGGDIHGIVVERGVFWNAEWGNALEIGFETRADEIRDVVFRDCDVIHAEPERFQSGGVLTIHNGDRADIHDIRYEDIRVEDCGHKLIDFKVLWAQYSRDEQRGQVHDIVVKDVSVVDGPTPVSIVQGYDGKHLVRNVRIENLRLHGERVTDYQSARLVTERSSGITFA